MLHWLNENYTILACLLILLVGVVIIASGQPVQAAPVDVEVCEHVATADSIKVFYCEDINLFVNQLGFMSFEP